MESTFNDLLELTTEKVNTATQDIDQLSTIDMLKKINQEDQGCVEAVRLVLTEISAAVDLIVNAMKAGGRLFYIGAGTSGRLGVLDASECPPTFGVEHTLVQGIIAGGNEALVRSKEGSEDDAEQGWIDLQARQLQTNDLVCGIMASGRTPYVIGALNKAKQAGLKTISISCNTSNRLKVSSDVDIRIDAGPEVIMGSTRMKAGTCQKMILNMLSTASMIRLGKVYKNIMVDVKQNSEKLQERSKRIVMELCSVDYLQAEKLLQDANGSAKIAIAMHLTGKSRSDVAHELEKHDGFLAPVIDGVES